MIKATAIIFMCLFVNSITVAQKPSPKNKKPASEYEQKVNEENKRHNWGEGTLRAGDPAPDFNLKVLDSSQRRQLSSFAGKKLVALVFGTYSCPLFRSDVPTLNEMANLYKNKVEFLLIYIREAHPVGGLPDVANEREGISVTDANSLEDKELQAAICMRRLDIKFTTLIDEMDNRVELAYSAWPDRLYLIGKDGRIAWKGRPGAVGFVPAELAVAIEEALEH